MQHDQSQPAFTVVPSGATLTRSELERQVAQFADVLTADTQHDDDQRVAILLGNQLEYPIVVLGARNSGFDHLPLNTHSNVHELASILGQFRPTVIVVSDVFTEKAKALNAELDPAIRRIMVGKAIPGWEPYQDLMAMQLNGSQPERTGRLLLLSGGSTGQSKIVVRPNAAKRGAPKQGSVFSVLSLGSEDVVLIPAPLYHTMPVGWMVSGLDAGAHVVVMERWNTELALQVVERFRVTLWALVPTMMYRLLDLPDEIRFKYDISSLRAALHGTAPCSKDKKLRFLEWIPCLFEGYGMTEGFGMCIIGPDEWLAHPGSVGKAIAGCRVVIRDHDGNEVPTGTVGRIWFARTDGARMSYLGQSEETTACYNEHGEGTAFDCGYIDEEGYLFIVGRDKNMIISGGVNIYPGEIETTLLQHAAVADVCVVGQPDDDLGEAPVAVVQAYGHACEDLAAELAAHCRQSIGRLRMPRQIVFTTQLPREATGKISLGRVRALVNLS